jgi:hypothetical protein
MEDTWRIRLVAAVRKKILGEGNPRTHPLIYIRYLFGGH